MKRIFGLIMCLTLLVPFGIGNVSADQTRSVDSTEILPLSSALHVLPPLGNDNEKIYQIDQTLIDFLLVSICQVDGGECTPVYEFTSQKTQKGLDYIKLQNKSYHVNWNISKSDSGKSFEIHFIVAGLDIGNVGYTPKNGKSVPIKFIVENHPRLRTRLLKEQGYLTLEIFRMLEEEFSLSTNNLLQILFEEDFSAVDVGAVLKDAYGLSAPETALALKLTGYFVSEIGQTMKDVYYLDALGVTEILREIGCSAEQVYKALQENYGLDLEESRTILDSAGYPPDEIYQIIVPELALKFAPQLRFDSGDWSCPGRDSYPMSAQIFYDKMIKNGPTLDILINEDSNSVSGNKVPTYWKAFPVGLKQIRLVYWWFYGYQCDCDCFSGEHHGDWEHIVVTLSEDTSKVAAVTFFQHGGNYTRIAARGGFELYENTHPVVYVGRANHGSYHNTQTGFQTCCYWDDHRDGGDVWLNSWESDLKKLQPSSEGGEEWMDADLVGDFLWGPDGISNHPMSNNSGSEGMDTCKGTPTWGCHESGCFRSQCEIGDRDDGITCWHCPAGYTDIGAFCVEDCGWGPFCKWITISTYSLEYPLSSSDAGLLYKNPYR